MYLNCGVPCADCARAIINAGIVEYFKRGGGAKSDKWLESAARSEMMFDEGRC